MPRVTRLVGVGLEMAKRMSNPEGIGYAELLQHLGGSPQAVYNLIYAISDLANNLSDTIPKLTGQRFVDNHPTLWQGGEDGDGEWDGQPIVYDGGFDIQYGELWFSGMSEYSGFGHAVTRKVMSHDVIHWSRCEDMIHYERGI